METNLSVFKSLAQIIFLSCRLVLLNWKHWARVISILISYTFFNFFAHSNIYKFWKKRAARWHRSYINSHWNEALRKPL